MRAESAAERFFDAIAGRPVKIWLHQRRGDGAPPTAYRGALPGAQGHRKGSREAGLSSAIPMLSRRAGARRRTLRQVPERRTAKPVLHNDLPSCVRCRNPADRNSRAAPVREVRTASAFQDITLRILFAIFAEKQQGVLSLFSSTQNFSLPSGDEALNSAHDNHTLHRSSKGMAE